MKIQSTEEHELKEKLHVKSSETVPVQIGAKLLLEFLHASSSGLAHANYRMDNH